MRSKIYRPLSLQDGEAFTAELKRVLSIQKVDLVELSRHTGFLIDNLDKFPRLQSLVLRITLHADAADGPWVEVAPPGNWI